MSIEKFKVGGSPKRVGFDTTAGEGLPKWAANLTVDVTGQMGTPIRYRERFRDLLVELLDKHYSATL